MMTVRKQNSVPLSQMKQGHIKAGQVVRLGWPAGMGDGLFLVLETYNPSIINDLKVVAVNAGVAGEVWYTRSTGAVVMG